LEGFGTDLKYFIFFDDELNIIKFGKRNIASNEFELYGYEFNLFFSDINIKIFTSYDNEKTLWLYSSHNIIYLLEELNSSIINFVRNIKAQEKFIKFYKKLSEKYSIKYPEFFI
jgi:hypothetical protein